MAVVSVTMNTKASAAGVLLPQDVELNILVLQLFYYACASREGFLGDIGDEVVIDEITLSNPFDIWAYLKSIRLETAKEVLGGILHHRSERERRSAIAAQEREKAISAKLDNIRKANEVRTELLASGADPEVTNRFLGRVLADQGTEIKLHSPLKRRSPKGRPLPF